MKKTFKRVFSLLFVFVLLVSMMLIPANAISTSSKTIPSFSSTKYLYTYSYASSGSVQLYSDSKLTKKATTVSYSKPVKIVKVISSTVVQVSYNSKTYYASREKYTYRDFAKDTTAPAWTATKSVPTYKYKNNETKLGTIDKNDLVYIIRGNSDSDWIQVIYPNSADQGYFMGWCKGIDVYGSPSTTSTIVWPCASSYEISCLYYYKDGSKHGTRYDYRYAIDITGGGNIVAAASGTVKTVAYQSGGFGNYIVIEHSNGALTLYGHLASTSVTANQKVTQGQKIGVMGNTGNSSGTHLHFEYSAADPWKTFFKDQYKTKLTYQSNVYTNNNKYNADKTVVNWLKDHYKLSNGKYVWNK